MDVVREVCPNRIVILVDPDTEDDILLFTLASYTDSRNGGLKSPREEPRLKIWRIMIGDLLDI